MTAVSLGPSPSRRDVLAHRIRLLVAATITWNVIEAAVALTAGTLSSSAALTGFGLDSVVEVCSAAAVAWQFSARGCPPPSAGPAANSVLAPPSPTPGRPCCAPACPRCC